MFDKKSVIGASIFVGFALEVGIHVVSGQREAWDSPQFWIIGVPCALAAAAFIGFRWRGADWVWTFLIVPSQVTTMIMRSGEIGSLWPLTVVLSTVLSAPFVVAAFISSRFRPT